MASCLLHSGKLIAANPAGGGWRNWQDGNMAMQPSGRGCKRLQWCSHAAWGYSELRNPSLSRVLLKTKWQLTLGEIVEILISAHFSRSNIVSDYVSINWWVSRYYYRPNYTIFDIWSMITDLARESKTSLQKYTFKLFPIYRGYARHLSWQGCDVSSWSGILI